MNTPQNTHGQWISPDGFPLLEVNWSGQLGEDEKTPVGVETRPTGFDSPAPLSQGERVAYEYELQRWHMDEATAKRGVSGDAIFQPAQPILDTDSDVERQAKREANVRNAWDLATYDRVLATRRYETAPQYVAPMPNAETGILSSKLIPFGWSPPVAPPSPESLTQSALPAQAATIVQQAAANVTAIANTAATLPVDHPHRSTLFALLGHLGSLLKVAAPIAAELVAANNPKYAGALAAVEAVQSTNPPTP